MADDRPDAEFISVKYDPRWTNRKPRAAAKRVGIFDGAGKLMPWALAALPEIAKRVKRTDFATKADLAVCVLRELRRLEPLDNG